MRTVQISSVPADRFDGFVPAASMRRFNAVLDEGAERFAERTLWHVNSTAQGGGVAEMLQSLLGYLLGAGIRTRWVVIDGDEAFFDVTKRLHHLLHGTRGDGGSVDAPERRTYERNLSDDLGDLVERVQPGDAVVLHDPQTLGLAPGLREAGAHVVWSCHVGIDEPNDLARGAWDFLRPYVDATDAQVFSRRSYVWEGLGPEGVEVIPPCIDAFAPKNQPLDAPAVKATLRVAGLTDDGGADGSPAFVRRDGTEGLVTRTAELDGEPLPASARIVLQVSRWDPLKDPVGVLRAFVAHVPCDPTIRLVLAGPEAEATSDDPEAEETLAQVRAARDGLSTRDRARVLLASLPMHDVDENAAIVNALQRRAAVVVQKSLAEGFGLTVAEAMWKERAVVASRVGGIQDQIVDGVSGTLVDPTDPEPSAARSPICCTIPCAQATWAGEGALASARSSCRLATSHACSTWSNGSPDARRSGVSPVFLSLFLTCVVALALATILLLLAGHRGRFTFRPLGSLLAVAVVALAGQIAKALFDLPPEHVLVAEVGLFVFCIAIVILRPQ